MLIYGGKNDHASEIKDSSGQDLSVHSDIFIYDLARHSWSCIGQQGFRPSPRWNAGIAVSDQLDKIYMFGGSNHKEGQCSNKVY